MQYSCDTLHQVAMLTVAALSGVSLYYCGLVTQGSPETELFTLSNKDLNVAELLGCNRTQDPSRCALLDKLDYSSLGLSEEYKVYFWGYEGISPDHRVVVPRFDLDLFSLYSSEITNPEYATRARDIRLPMTRPDWHYYLSTLAGSIEGWLSFHKACLTVSFGVSVVSLLFTTTRSFDVDEDLDPIVRVFLAVMCFFTFLSGITRRLFLLEDVSSNIVRRFGYDIETFGIKPYVETHFSSYTSVLSSIISAVILVISLVIERNMYM